MSINVANPWLKVARQKSPPYLAECDQDIKLADFYNLHIELLPQPYFGNVISAKVVCLLLNPGYSRTEDIVELDCRKLQQALRDNLDSTTSWLVHLDDEFDWTSGGQWFRQKIFNPLSRHGVTCDGLNRNFAVVEYFPYYSSTFDIKLNKPLESQHYGFELVRQAISNNATILLMRGKKLWRQAVPELVHYQKSGDYITPHSSRNVILSEKNLGKENFTKIVEALKT